MNRDANCGHIVYQVRILSFFPQYDILSITKFHGIIVVTVVQFGPPFFSQSESSIRISTGIEACDWLICYFLVENTRNLIECTVVENRCGVTYARIIIRPI